MKLSEAIRLAGVIGPQGRGAESMRCSKAPCALGGVAIVVGIPLLIDAENCVYSALRRRFPSLTRYVYERIKPGICGAEVIKAIWQLNDDYYYTRDQIADWIVENGFDCEAVTEAVLTAEAPTLVLA